MALTDIHLWEMSTAVSLIPVDYSALPESKAILATRRDFNPSHSRLFTRRVKTLPEWSPVPPSNFFQPFPLCLPEAGPWQAGSSRDMDRHAFGEAGALGKAESQRLVHILAEAWGRSLVKMLVSPPPAQMAVQDHGPGRKTGSRGGILNTLCLFKGLSSRGGKEHRAEGISSPLQWQTPH